MYKYLLSIPLILFPYLLLFLLYCLITGFLMEELFVNNGFLLIAVLVVGGFISFVCTVALCLSAVVKNQDSLAMARLNMVVKLVHVPAYIAIFVLSLIFSITVFGIGFVIVFALSDAFSILMSGLIGGVAATLARRQQAGLPDWIAYAVLQFIYCVDVVSCVVMYCKIKKFKLHQKTSLQV